MKKNEMKKSDMFAKELGELCRKYDLMNCIFAGEDETEKLIGFHCIEKEGCGYNIKDLIASSFNASRLYQSAREKILNAMDGE